MPRYAEGPVLGWKRDRRTFEALVVSCDDAALELVVQRDWHSEAEMVPVPVDPNWTP